MFTENERRNDITETDSETLLELIKSDSPLVPFAEEELVRRYYPLVRSCARPFFLWGWDSEDFIQEGMMGLIKAIRSFDKVKSPYFGSYAELCIRRQLSLALGNNTRKKDIPHDMLTELSEGESNEEEPDRENDVEETVIYKIDIERKLQKVIEKLSPLEKKVLEQYIQGGSLDEISSSLSITKRSVNNAIYRIKSKSADVG